MAVRLREDGPDPETRVISSFEEFDEIMANLHDWPFDLDNAEFDEVDGVWSAAFLRPLWKAPGVERERSKLLLGRFLDVSKRLAPVARALIHVRGVAQVRVIADQGIQYYAFNQLKRTADGVRFHFCQALKIDLHLAGGIDATYQEEPFPGVLVDEAGGLHERLADRGADQALA